MSLPSSSSSISIRRSTAFLRLLRRGIWTDLGPSLTVVVGSGASSFTSSKRGRWMVMFSHSFPSDFGHGYPFKFGVFSRCGSLPNCVGAAFNAPVLVTGDDDVVEHLYVQKHARIDDLLGNEPVIRRRLRIARRVIVGQDDRVGIRQDGELEHFSWVDNAGVETPNGDNVHAYDRASGANGD